MEMFLIFGFNLVRSTMTLHGTNQQDQKLTNVQGNFLESNIKYIRNEYKHWPSPQPVLAHSIVFTPKPHGTFTLNSGCLHSQKLPQSLCRDFSLETSLCLEASLEKVASIVTIQRLRSRDQLLSREASLERVAFIVTFQRLALAFTSNFVQRLHSALKGNFGVRLYNQISQNMQIHK